MRRRSGWPSSGGLTSLSSLSVSTLVLRGTAFTDVPQAVGPLTGWRALGSSDVAVHTCSAPAAPRQVPVGLRDTLCVTRSAGMHGAGAQDSPSGFGFAPSLGSQRRADDPWAVVCLFIFHLINIY